MPPNLFHSVVQFSTRVAILEILFNTDLHGMFWIKDMRIDKTLIIAFIRKEEQNP